MVMDLELPNMAGNLLFPGHAQIHHNSKLCIIFESLVSAGVVSHNGPALPDHFLIMICAGPKF